MDARVPISTILPRYITATRSEMWRTTARAWGTKQCITPATFAELALAAFMAPEAALVAPTRPVYLEIPTDLLSAEGEEPAMSGWGVSAATPDVEPALDVIADAQRPLVWAGGGAVAA